jgi:hypothetical protein
MSTPKGTAPKSGLNQGGYTTSWRSTVSSETLDPQYYGNLVQLYGDMLRLYDIMMWAKKSAPVKGRSITVFEEGAITDTIDLTSVIAAGAAGAALTAVSTSKGVGRIGFDVYIPAQYTNQEIPVPYKITNKQGSYTYTLTPWNSAFQVTTEIPIGQKLILGASSYAPGEAQPAGMKRAWYKHTHATRIMKETLHIEGGQQALQELAALAQAQDGSTLVNRSLNETEFRLRIQQADFLLNGQPNNNSLVGSNSLSESNAVGSDYGLIPGMYAGAMRQYYTGGYGKDNFDVVKFLLASQGVGAGMVDFYFGQELGLGIENSGLEFVREFSGGTDLYKSLGEMGFVMKRFTKNGVVFNLIEVPEFSNPLAYGANGYNYETLGMIFPNTKVTASMNTYDNQGMSMGASEKKALSHVEVAYLSNNGEDRALVIGDAAGVNGMGYKFTNAYDQMSWYMLTEQMNILNALNQAILVLKSE